MKTQKKAPRIVLGTVLACGIGGAALLAASPAMAGGSGPYWANLASVSKTAPDGSPLAGAVLEICSTANNDPTEGIPGREMDVDMTGADGGLPGVEAAYRAQAQARSQATAIANATQRVTAEQARVDTAQAAFDAVAGDLLTDQGRADAQAAIDAYAPLQVEQDRLNAESAAAHATWQATVAEVVALQEAGQPVPADLAIREAEEQALAQAAAQAASDHSTATQPRRDTAIAGQNALDRDVAAQAAQTALTTLTTAQSDLTYAQNALAYASGDSFDSSWSVMWADRADRIAAQIAANSAAGISLDRTFDDNVIECWQGVSDESGTVTLPISFAESVTVEEIVAPDGFTKLDGRLVAGTDSAFTAGAWEFGGGANGGNVQGYTLVNEPAVPPVDPPVEPPVETPPTTPEEPVKPEKPVEKPAEPVEETLAYTGSDTNGAALAGVAGLLALAAGGALTIFRRRTAE